MKFFITCTLIATVASAAFLKPVPVSNDLAEIAEIVAAIQSPSTDPATAAALEAMIHDLLSPISVGPAIVGTSPISVGPAIVPFPVPVEESAVVQPSPIVIGEIPAGSSPLVQIIVNVQQQETAPGVLPAPVEAPVVPEDVYFPGPVNVVDLVVPESVVEPIVVVEPVLPGPVNVIDNVVVEPVQVAEPIVVAPVIVGTPIIPAPAVVLPEELN